MKDAVATMGGVLPEDAGGRDAVHVAVFSATSPERMYPGQPVGLSVYDEASARDRTVTGQTSTKVGIVDPFLDHLVEVGGRFWVYLYPRTITGLSHRWSHPAFDDVEEGERYATPADKVKSEEWLRDFCNIQDAPSYEGLLYYVRKHLDEGPRAGYGSSSLYTGASDAHGAIPDELWDHVEVVLGRKVEGPRPEYFSCAC